MIACGTWNLRRQYSSDVCEIFESRLLILLDFYFLALSGSTVFFFRERSFRVPPARKNVLLIQLEF